MKELYVLARFDSDEKFVEYVRKGRNNSISGYDNLESAKRGLSHTKGNKLRKGAVKIIKATTLEVVDSEQIANNKAIILGADIYEG